MGRFWVGGEDRLSPSSRLAAVQPVTRTPLPTLGGQDGGRGWELFGRLHWKQISHPTKWSFGGLEPPSGNCSERWTRHLRGEQNSFSPRKSKLSPDTLAQAQSPCTIVLLCSNHRERPEGRIPVFFLGPWLSTKTFWSGNPD